jgi:hypothetical protein
MRQSVLELLNFSRALLFLKLSAQTSQALIAFCLAASRFTARQAIRRFFQRKFAILKSRQDLGDQLSHLE